MGFTSRLGLFGACPLDSRTPTQKKRFAIYTYPPSPFCKLINFINTNF